MLDQNLTGRERFLSVMEYQPVDRVPNHEVGVWGQTIDRWAEEGLDIHQLHWDWFTGEEFFDMDAREYISVNFDLLPRFDPETIEETDRYVIARNDRGILTKGLVEGASRGMRASMDQYLSFPVTNLADFREMKKRYNPDQAARYPPQWRAQRLPGWKARQHVLVLGVNCSTTGFYWRAREWMGTEALSYAWYDQPALMHEMMEFIADFTMAVSRPILEEIAPDYVFINEDMAMKNGPLLSPKTYRTFIFPHMRRLVDFYKHYGVRYVLVDTDGNSDALIPLLMDAGVDGIWPMERASDMDPIQLRKKYGRALRLWGGVDKRELTKDLPAIDAHLLSLAPLVEDGGFIPTIDHLAPPDIPLKNFLYYMEKKKRLLRGQL
ncbi:MAG TPA: uroporphyrinogen decarboxylase family protein [Anaerolineaceae bacterium]|jgi:Uroporphyrinogen decarboxylase (URO-D)